MILACNHVVRATTLPTKVRRTGLSSWHSLLNFGVETTAIQLEDVIRHCTQELLETKYKVIGCNSYFITSVDLTGSSPSVKTNLYCPGIQ